MRRILLIEDNPDDVALVLRAVTAKWPEARVQVVSDGQEALEVLEINETPSPENLPDAIILDLKLPKLSGHEVLEKLHANERMAQVPVLVLSSSYQPTDVDRATKYGARYMRKPDDYYDFLAQVGSALDQMLPGTLV